MGVNLMEGIAISKVVAGVLIIGMYLIFGDEQKSSDSQPTTYRNSVGGKKRSRKNRK